MPRYWWVSHNQTAQQEIDGQYLWSPKTRSDGKRNEFYLNMRKASPGDIVLSFSGAAVRFIGRVAEFAFTAPKPPEFGTIGSNWSNSGWLLPVFWMPLSVPVSPKERIDQLRPYLPRTYSPINPRTGDGNQNMYLAEIPPEVFAAIIAANSYDERRLATGGANSLNYDVVKEILEDALEQHIQLDDSIEGTVKKQLVLARRGQGIFRSRVLKSHRACRLTGITNPELLIASHIKPWRECETAAERLDEMNGLLLTPDADRLFDRGFITFLDDGRTHVSPRADPHDLVRLGFRELVSSVGKVSEDTLPWHAAAFAEEQCAYMRYHRHDVFLT